MDIEKVKLYFARLGLTVPETPVPDAALLRTLHRAHCLRIPYENTQYRNKTLVPVEREALYRHIVLEKHGGLCLDLNGCFLWLLTELGYRVSSLSVCRILGEVQTAFPHRVLLVTDCGGTQWWCDVADTLTMLADPLLLLPDTVQHSNGETLRFQKTGSGLRLECLRADNWIGRYLYEYKFMSDEEAFRNKADRFAALDENDVLSSPFFLIKTAHGGRMLFGGRYREITDGVSFTRDYTDGELPALCRRFFMEGV